MLMVEHSRSLLIHNSSVYLHNLFTPSEEYVGGEGRISLFKLKNHTARVPRCYADQIGPKSRSKSPIPINFKLPLFIPHEDPL